MTTVLGIETSCDETAAAVVNVPDDASVPLGRVLSESVATQFSEHAPYGGVVPEIASRAHMRSIGPVVRDAVARAGGWGVLDAIAVTARPGLVGALLVGLQAAKGIAFARKLPLVEVDHLAAHLLAVFLDRDGGIGGQPEFPFIGLLVSGGHTALYRIDGPTSMTLLGATRDDAAGEAFDKIAKLCNLGYPGGPIIDRLATNGRPDAIRLPQPMRRRDSLEFSFSGLKTAVATHIERRGGAPTDPTELADLAASVQHAIVETLVRKLMCAVEQTRVPRVVIAGGVAANRGLRATAQSRCNEKGISLYVPAPASCTDNGAMIAYAGAMELRAVPHGKK